MKYVVFLDIDGVLNSRGYFQTDIEYIDYFKFMGDMAYRTDTKRFMHKNLDKAAVRNFRFLLENLPKNTEVWISSSWGKVFTMKQIIHALKARGLREYHKSIKAVTPKKMSSYRCNEIGWALEKIRENYKGQIRWVTIDDDAIFSDTYIEEVIYRDKLVKVPYNPEYRTDKENGLTFQDVRAILTMLIPDWKPNMERI